MLSTRLFGLVAATALLLVGSWPAAAAQVCGCKNGKGRISRITAGTLPSCSSQTLICWNDQTSTVTGVTAGAGLEAMPVNPITGAGTISVNAPTCMGTDKLSWDGIAFQCSADQTGTPTSFSTLYTPPLMSGNGNTAYCMATNLGNAPSDIYLELLDQNGMGQGGASCPAIQPGHGCNVGSSQQPDTPIYCKISFNPASTNVRGSMFWLDANGFPTGTVAAQ